MSLIIRRDAEIVKIEPTFNPASGSDGGSDLFTVRVSISSPAEDSHHTIMGQSSLDNFLRQSNDGVPVCPNHVKQSPIGITSKSERDEQGIIYCNLDIDRDLPLASANAGYPNSDVIIRQIQNGRIRKTSVGAYNGELICNIDGKNLITDWGCWHWPGREYEEKDPEDPKKLVTKRCVPVWENLDLGEVSTVWAGSNPDAEIMKVRADALLEKGLLKKSDATRVNYTYGLSLDVSRAQSDKTIFDLGRNSMPTQEELQALQEKLDAAEEARQKAEEERDALLVDSETLSQECDLLRQENLSKYKTLRGDLLTSDDLKAYEDKMDKLELPELKSEKVILDKALPSQDADLGNDEIVPGRATSDPNNSLYDSGKKSEPSWMRRKI